VATPAAADVATKRRTTGPKRGQVLGIVDIAAKKAFSFGAVSGPGSLYEGRFIKVIDGSHNAHNDPASR
jgi:hypothetical protein